MHIAESIDTSRVDARQFTSPGKLVDDLSETVLWLKQHNSCVSATARRLTDRVRTTPDHAADEKASISGLAA